MVRDGLVYLVAGDDTGWAVNTSDGRIAWQVEGVPSPSNVLGAPSPVIAGDYVIFAFGSGDLVASFRRGGVRRWNASVAGQRVGTTLARLSDVTGAPVVVGNRAFVGNHSGRTVAIDTNNGDRIWTAQEGAIGPVWPAGGSLFQISDRNQLLRLDASSGEVIWAVDLPGYLKDKPSKRGAVVADALAYSGGHLGRDVLFLCRGTGCGAVSKRCAAQRAGHRDPVWIRRRGWHRVDRWQCRSGSPAPDDLRTS